MKAIKKMSSLLMVIALVLSFIVPTTSIAEGNGTNKVTLHKLLLSKSEFDSWVTPDTYDATQDTAEKLKAGTKEIPDVYFAWQNSKGKWINEHGIEVTRVNDALGGLTKKVGDVVKGKEFNTSNLPEGKYKIVEVPELSKYVNNGAVLTGSKAVPVDITLPVINKNGVVNHAHVYPKNIEDKPDVKKKIKGQEYPTADTPALSKNVGDVVEYEIKTDIPVSTKYRTLIWSDTMSKGLTFNKGTIVIKLDGIMLEAEDYTKIETLSGFELRLTSNGLDKVNSPKEEENPQGEKVEIQKVITLEYSATINTLAKANKPDENSIILEYGNNVKVESTPPEIKPENQNISIKKTWAEGIPPENVSVTYDLFEKQIDGDLKLIDSVTLVSTKEKPLTNFDYTFKELANDKFYKVIERPSGYTPEYSSTVNGIVNIKNTKRTDTPDPIIPEKPSVVTHGKKFIKKNGNTSDSLALAGAQFYIRDGKGKEAKYLVAKPNLSNNITEYETAQKNYSDAIAEYNTLIGKDKQSAEDTERINLLKGAGDGSISDLKDKRDKAYYASNLKYTWESLTSEGKIPTGAVVLSSDLSGQFEITGLTVGTYYLDEFKAPSGYALQEGAKSFEITRESYDQPDGIMTIVNMEINIPQTGGMGTVLFTIAGLGIMTLAFVMLKKKNIEV